MKYAFPLLIALALLLLDLVTLVTGIGPLLVAVALLFAKWDDKATLDSNGMVPAVRGDLPSWAWWLGTPNERLPGGTYEPTVRMVLADHGRFVCSWYWLAIRNRQQGLAAYFGVPVVMPWPPEPGYYESGALWWLRHPIFGNKYQLKAGWRTYGIKSQWMAIPCLTITKA
jgi:hypothetical protein